MIALQILGKQQQVVASVILCLLIEKPALGNVHLATDDGLELLLVALAFVYLAHIVVELLYSHHVAMVGDGNTLHPVANGFVNEFFNGGLTVKD